METCIRNEERSRANIQSRPTDPKIGAYCRSIVRESQSLMEACIRNEEEAKRRIGK